MKFEACVESLEGALLAQKYNADRVELCSALLEGGLSPSTALVSQVRRYFHGELFPMIRPLSGNFVYSHHDLDLMEEEIAYMAKAGADGVVFGVLSEDGTLDVEANHRLVAQARRHQIQAVCHRAFDFTPEPYIALEQTIELGFCRILSSGQKPKAIDGLDLLKHLHQKAAGRIEIMAGSGVLPQNLPAFAGTDLDAVHFTVGAFAAEIDLGMGARLISDEGKVRDIMRFKK